MVYKDFTNYLHFRFVSFRRTSRSAERRLKIYFDMPIKAYLDAVHTHALIYADYSPLKPLLYYLKFDEIKGICVLRLSDTLGKFLLLIH